MTVDDLLAVKSVSDPQVSPDGKLVVYVVSELDRSTRASRTATSTSSRSPGASRSG